MVMDVVVNSASIDFREQVGRENLPRRSAARVSTAQAQHVRGVSINDRKLVRDEEDAETLFRLDGHCQAFKTADPLPTWRIPDGFSPPPNSKTTQRGGIRRHAAPCVQGKCGW